MSLPRGQVQGIPVFAGVPAIEVHHNPIMHLVTNGSIDTLLDLGCRNLYSSLPKETRTLVDQMDENAPTQRVFFRNASPLHYAIQQGDIRTSLALLLLDPNLIYTTAVLDDGRRFSPRFADTRLVTPLKMAQMFMSKNGEHGGYLHFLIFSWQSLIQNGVLAVLPTARARIQYFGHNTPDVIKNMLLLADDDLDTSLLEFIYKNSYNMIFLLAMIPGEFNVQNIKGAAEVPLSPVLRPFFPGTGENARVQIEDVNLLHHALLAGRYDAACALLILCPQLISYKVRIMQPAITFSTSMIVKVFPSKHSEDRRLACFKVMRLAEQDISKLVPLGLPDRRERAAAAGLDVSVLLSRWMQSSAHVDASYIWNAPVSLVQNEDP